VPAATLTDIASEAGVSVTTVSLAFQPGSRISDGTRRKILRIARRDGYVPNQAARNLRRRRTLTLGVIVPDITNPFFATLIRHAETVALGRGYEVVSAESRWDGDAELRAIESMARLRVDGLLFCCSETSPESIPLLSRYGIRHVLMDSCPAEYEGPFVGNDLKEAGRLAGEHLAAVGCRAPVFLSGAASPSPFSSFRLLREGFAEGLHRGGVTWWPERTVPAGLTFEAGLAAGRALLGAEPQTDGVFCANDACAWGAMQAVGDAGRTVGRDVAVIGVDDLTASRMSRVSLTSIRQPYPDLARIAAGSLIDAIEDDTAKPIRASLAPELIVRDSTRTFHRPTEADNS
jgi:DNA-binding LacI/PurR family transcriptional regulator